MPVCSQPGCPNIVKRGRCDACEKQSNTQDRQRRGSARERGYTPTWDKYSLWFIRQIDCDCGRNHALCERCQAVGKIEASEMTDHIIPVTSADDPRFWDHSNHQGLSRNCHAIKTAEDVAKGLTR